MTILTCNQTARNKIWLNYAKMNYAQHSTGKTTQGSLIQTFDHAVSQNEPLKERVISAFAGKRIAGVATIFFVAALVTVVAIMILTGTTGLAAPLFIPLAIAAGAATGLALISFAGYAYHRHKLNQQYKSIVPIQVETSPIQAPNEQEQFPPTQPPTGPELPPLPTSTDVSIDHSITPLSPKPEKLSLEKCKELYEMACKLISEKRELETAVENLKKIVNNQEWLWEKAMTKLGEYYQDERIFYTAIEWYKKAFELYIPKSARKRCACKIAECYQELSDHGQVIVWGEQALSQGKIANLDVGNIYEKAGLFRHAHMCYVEIVKDTNWEATKNAEWEAAKKAIETLLNNPQYKDHLEEGESASTYLTTTSTSARGLERVEESTPFSSSNEQAQRVVIEIPPIRPQPVAPKPNPLPTISTGGSVGQSIDFLSPAPEKLDMRKSEELYDMARKLILGKRDLEKAVESLEKIANSEHRVRLSAMKLLGDYYSGDVIQEKQMDTAISWYKRAFEEGSKSFKIKCPLKLVNCYLKQSNFEKVAFWSKQAISFGGIEKNYDIGGMYENHRLFKMAHTHYLEAAKAEGSREAAEEAIAFLLQKPEYTDRLEEDKPLSTEPEPRKLSPEERDAMYETAKKQAQAGNLRLAIESFKKIVTQYKYSARALVMEKVGDCYKDLEDVQNAIYWYTEASNHFGSKPPHLLCKKRTAIKLAQCYQKLGNLNQVISWGNTAMPLQGKEGDDFHLGVIYEKVGLFKDAHRCYLKIVKNEEWVKKAKEAIASLLQNSQYTDRLEEDEPLSIQPESGKLSEKKPDTLFK